ncbi:alpha/beta hydrolase [Mycobacterium sp. TY815]|uniref:alpha/beta hydrolase n=1 Tax=Mycobacterium sp. TY815 TaxID=3050581 RepID=UPI002740D7AA|nr:alpha/beta fold hydrolase [Mycobacterium sp. TY815]
MVAGDALAIVVFGALKEGMTVTMSNAGTDNLHVAPATGLETIDKGRGVASHPNPLLFVHGAAHAAWCWDEHFLDFFAERGFRAVAVSLRGHGGSPAPGRLSKVSLADYVDDVHSVARRLPAAPILIGHSLGGFVVQKYLEVHQAPAGVLLASAPPQGLLRFMLRSARRHPLRMARATVTGKSVRMINTPPRAREAFFSPETAEADVARWAARFDEESPRPILDTMFNPAQPQHVSAPLLVLGAELDRSITTSEVHATAGAYRTRAEIFVGMGHDMMLEPRWPAVAERIRTWLASQGW